MKEPFAADALMSQPTRWTVTYEKLEEYLRQTLVDSRAVHMVGKCELIVEKDNKMYIYEGRDVDDVTPATLDGLTVELAEVISTSSF